MKLRNNVSCLSSVSITTRPIGLFIFIFLVEKFKKKKIKLYSFKSIKLNPQLILNLKHTRLKFNLLLSKTSRLNWLLLKLHSLIVKPLKLYDFKYNFSFF